MSQSTSTGFKIVLPNNRDPRYFRPTYLIMTLQRILYLHKLKTMTVQIMKLLKSNNKLWTCNICHKALQTERSLKLHRTTGVIVQ